MACDTIVLAAKLTQAKNTIARSVTAAKIKNLPKFWTETTLAMKQINEARAMCHDEVPHEHPAPTPKPTPTTIRALTVGQSHSVDYVDYWSGAFRKMNPEITWVDGLNQFISSGAGIGIFETWLQDIKVLKPTLVLISAIPSDLVNNLSRYLTFIHELKQAGAAVVMNSPWQTGDTTAAQRESTYQALTTQHGGPTVVADFTHHWLLGAEGAEDNPALYRDDIHWSEIHRVGGHAFALAIWSAAVAKAYPGIKVYPEPVATAAHRAHLPANTTPAPTPTPAPHPHPMPTPVGQWIKASDIQPVPDIFDLSQAIGDVAPHADNDGAPDNVGAFRMGANASHLNYDDPIVFPGQPGAAHLHMYYGNRSVDAHSTYESLRRNPANTSDASMVDGTGRWAPALLDGKGNVLIPNFVTLYYKREPKSAPLHFRQKGWADLPRGIRFVFGANYDADPIEEDSHGRSPVSFGLLRNGTWVNTERKRYLDEIAALALPGDEIHATLTAPECWDGVHVDSPNHRGHLKYGYWQKGEGRWVVPESHPYVIPTITNSLSWVVKPGDDPKLFAFSSDIAMGKRPGETFHGDYFEAWSDPVKQMWHDNAINRLLSCVSADFGNGKIGKRWPGFGFNGATSVPMPPRVGNTYIGPNP